MDLKWTSLNTECLFSIIEDDKNKDIHRFVSKKYPTSTYVFFLGYPPSIVETAFREDLEEYSQQAAPPNRRSCSVNSIAVRSYANIENSEHLHFTMITPTHLSYLIQDFFY